MASLSCSKKNEEISPDSIYNVSSKWEKQDGKTITFSDMKGKVLVTAMIFTSCKTACPRLTAEMRTISQKVGKTNPEDIQYVLISIDPKNVDSTRNDNDSVCNCPFRRHKTQQYFPNWHHKLHRKN